METSIPGVFACGNGLHVHDLVDFVSMEGEEAGAAAAKYLRGELIRKEDSVIEAGNGISYVLPSYIDTEAMEESMEIKCRVTGNARNVKLTLKNGDKLIKEIKKLRVAPSEMEKIEVKKAEFGAAKGRFVLALEEL